MGSSMRKKKEKKKDFQKPKLRVGKTKAKPDNFTDTSFKAKSIVLNQQSLTTVANSVAIQFVHYLSLASSSRSDTQRKDALAYLTSQLSAHPANLPPLHPTADILRKLNPLMLDGSNSVRTNLLKLLKLLPAQDVSDRAGDCMMYVRAGLTHLASEIRVDAINVLEWLLACGEEDVVSCPGGWVKTLKAFMAMLSWATTAPTSNKWSSAPKSSLGKTGKAFPRQLAVLAKFLKAGLVEVVVERLPERYSAFFVPVSMIEANMMPKRSNPYAHLGLFARPRDEESEMYMDYESRQSVFHKLFQAAVDNGIKNAVKEGGEAGRAAAILRKVVTEGMASFDEEDTLY